MQFPRSLALLLASVALWLGGCSGPHLVEAPYAMRNQEARDRYAALPASIQTPDIPVLYVTNRAVDNEAASGPEYGFKRAHEMSYGVARVGLDPVPTWDQLVQDSTTFPRAHRYGLAVEGVEPVGRVEPLMRYMAIENGRIVVARDGSAGLLAAREEFDNMFDLWFGPGAGGDAYLFVHGFNNTFDDAILRVAETWHLMGRPGVPIGFSWPAGSGGLKGYAYDRESGEYSVVPLKSLIWMLAASPRIKHIHIIAHSRGTDVATTALREIQFEIRGLYDRSLFAPLAGKTFVDRIDAGTEVFDILKLSTLVLAAPDMDLDVFGQRFLNEGLIHVADRTVIYGSEKDQALGLSNWLFRGRSRLGDMRLDRMDPKIVEIISGLDKVEFVSCAVTGGDSHAYVFQHPSALSDLILVTRDGQVAGERSRPLTRANACVWRLDNAYLKPE